MTVKEQIEMREAGYSIKAIAEKAGAPPSTIATRLRKWGVRPPHRLSSERLDPSLADEINSLYWEQGMTMRETAKALGISEGAVHYRMVAFGIPRRDRHEAIKEYFKTHDRVRCPTGMFTSESGRRAALIQKEQERERGILQAKMKIVRAARTRKELARELVAR